MIFTQNASGEVTAAYPPPADSIDEAPIGDYARGYVDAIRGTPSRGETTEYERGYADGREAREAVTR